MRQITMKILHIVHDEKFIDIAYRLFESASPGNNTFVIISKPSRLKYIKYTPVKFVSRLRLLQNKFIESLNEYSMVVLHCMDDTKLQLLARADNKVKFVWLGWGVDYYDLITEDNNKLLLPRTLSILKGTDSTDIRKNQIKKIFKRLFYGDINKKELVNRVNFFAPVLYEDYKLVKNVIGGFKPQYLPWNYGSLEDDLITGFDSVQKLGNNILVGNSSFPTNNHLDVFEELLTINLTGRKLLCPLNYGNVSYRGIVIREGHELFNGTFVPIIDYMSIGQYVKLLSSCSIAVMGHLRQQALGNVIIMLYLGAKVFLYKENPIYLFFKKEGAYIYSMEELKSEYQIMLSSAAIKHNRCVLQRYWSRDAAFAKTKNLIDIVTTD